LPVDRSKIPTFSPAFFLIGFRADLVDRQFERLLQILWIPAAEAAELLQHRPHIEAAQVSQLRGKDAKLDEEFETVPLGAIVSPRHRPAGALHANSVGLLESKVDAWYANDMHDARDAHGTYTRYRRQRARTTPDLASKALNTTAPRWPKGKIACASIESDGEPCDGHPLTKLTFGNETVHVSTQSLVRGSAVFCISLCVKN
ncbi:translation elongation factor EF-1 alpha/Tu, partial [Moesziomyces antarcticus T-34]